MKHIGESVNQPVAVKDLVMNEIVERGLEIKKYEGENGRRVWEIDEYEKMNCGGTHLANTKEIGRVKIKRKNIGAGKERIEITLA